MLIKLANAILPDYKIFIYLIQKKINMISNPIIYNFKITILKDGKPSAYRIIAIDKNTSLFTFAEVIIENFGFDCDHCFGFYDNTDDWFDSKEFYELFVDIDEESGEGVQSVKLNTIATAFAIRKNMLFLFNYGDEWLFLVDLIDKLESEPSIQYPKLIESKGKAPSQNKRM